MGSSHKLFFAFAHVTLLIIYRFPAFNLKRAHDLEGSLSSSILDVCRPYTLSKMLPDNHVVFHSPIQNGSVVPI